MGDGGATVIVHQTWASQPDGCIPLPPSWVGISSDPEEEPLRVYETATLIAGDDALHQECAFHHLVDHLNHRLNPHPPRLSAGRKGYGQGLLLQSVSRILPMNDIQSKELMM